MNHGLDERTRVGGLQVSRLQLTRRVYAGRISLGLAGVASIAFLAASLARGIPLSLAEVRPLAQVSALALMLSAGWSAVTAVMFGWKQRGCFTWQASWRALIWPLIGGAILGMSVFSLSGGQDAMPWYDRQRAVELALPLVTGIHCALAFAPEDEPGLEVLLACPRPPAWTLLERLAVIWSVFGVIGLAGALVNVLVVPGQAGGMALLRWIPPAALLSGIGAYTTLRTRVAAFGAAITAIIWFVFVFFGNALLPGVPMIAPLNYLTPLFWPIHPYLQPDDLSIGDYALNRVCVLLVGAGLVGLAVRELRDSERVLLGASRRRRQAGG